MTGPFKKKRLKRCKGCINFYKVGQFVMCNRNNDFKPLKMVCRCKKISNETAKLMIFRMKKDVREYWKVRDEKGYKRYEDGKEWGLHEYCVAISCEDLMKYLENLEEKLQKMKKG